MEHEPTHKFTIPLAIVAAGGLIAGAIYFGGSPSPSIAGSNNNGQPTEINIAKVTAEDHIRGSIDAPLVIVEYSDTECPFCKVFHNTMKEVLNLYGNKVAWVYRHFPIPQLHQLAVKEAEATECAAELGGNEGFWNYIDEVFERTNSNDSLNPSELPKIALAIGLNQTEFNDCLSSGRHNDTVQDMMEEAVKAGARGTPYSVIISKDGTKTVINGAEPLGSIRIKLDNLLK